ncbi:hypothetical protein [Burkholderia pseudomallei]|uniref:hypothetical protein n=1 Tax=Burkholderia pseudomallei TaxID=28450 RepID=UPI0011777238|nr:hypothetical protein [Burkholderia pseudomallei]
MIDVKKMRELVKETRHMAYVASEIGHTGAAEQFFKCADAILALCDRLEEMEHDREDQNRYLAAQSAEIAGLKQRLAQQPSVEVMEKRILKLADKYRIDYGGDYSRNAKEHKIDLLAFVRAVLPASTQELIGLSEFLRNHANYIAAKAPEVVEHVKQLRAWADALDAMPKSIAQQLSGEVTDFGEQALSILEELVRMRYEKCRIVCQDHMSAVTFQTARALIDAARTQGGES